MVIDGVHFAVGDRRGQDCPIFGAAVGTSGEIIAPDLLELGTGA